MIEEKDYITDDGEELTKPEAEKINQEQVDIVGSGDFEKMLDLHFIFPKKLVVDLINKEVCKNGRG